MISRNKGFASLILTAFILGTFGLWIRELDKVFSNEGQVIVRSLVASVVITLIIFIKKNKFAIPKNLRLSLLGFSLVFSLSILCFTYAATNIKVSNALFMLYVGSVTSTYLWGRFVFKENLSVDKIISIVLLVLGLYIFVYPFSVSALSGGVLAGIVAGILEGSAHGFRKKLKDMNREVLVFFQSLSGLIMGVSVFIFSGDNFTKTSLTISSAIVAIIFGCLLVAIGYLLAYGFGHFDVNVGSVVLATELFFALIVSAIFLHETPTAHELAGGLLIFTGSVVTSVDGEKIKKLLRTNLK